MLQVHCAIHILVENMVIPVLLIHLLFLSVVEGQSQTPYMTFLGENLMNLSYVDFSLVGDLDGGGDSVQCHTNLQDCCSREEGDLRGDWLFPDGMKLRFHSGAGVYQSRRAQRVDLRRSRDTSLTGIYCCTIPYDTGYISSRAMLCVRLGKMSWCCVLLSHHLKG